MPDLATGIAITALLLSGIAIAVVLVATRSLGCYTERIERANEGTRRSNELKRQSDERLRQEIADERKDNQLMRDESIAVFGELMRMRSECRYLHRTYTPSCTNTNERSA